MGDRLSKEKTIACGRSPFYTIRREKCKGHLEDGVRDEAFDRGVCSTSHVGE